MMVTSTSALKIHNAIHFPHFAFLKYPYLLIQQACVKAIFRHAVGKSVWLKIMHNAACLGSKGR